MSFQLPQSNNTKNSFGSNESINRHLESAKCMQSSRSKKGENFSMSISFCCAEKVAVKTIDKTKIDSASRRLIFREMAVLDKLHHPNIVRLYEVSAPSTVKS